MTKLDVELPDELIEELDAHGNNIKQVMMNMCDKAVDFLIPKVEASAPVFKGYLKLSFKKVKAKANRYGEIVGKLKSYGYEPGSSISRGYPAGKPNAIKAIVAEYGSRKQKKNPFLRPTMQKNESSIEQIMQQEYDDSIRGLK